MAPFISLNSWNEAGAILQAAEPEEIVAGGWEEWDKLRDFLARRRKTGGDSVHPQSAAVGYITYEGAFRFAWFPRISVLRENGISAVWDVRRAAEGAPVILSEAKDQFRCSGKEGQVGTDPSTSRHASMRSAQDDQDASFRSNMSRSQFESMVTRAQEYIAAGDIYQVNLAQKFTTSFGGNSYRLFEHLLARSPAPGGAFLDFGDTRILSASPELFLRIRGRHVTTRPIKGTRPRSRDPVLDAQLAYELQTDPKELAELIMITDLERNDLGQICEYGSVDATQLAQIEHFAQVHHLVSTIEGMLRPDIDALAAVRACVPGGSISGAPRKRAREIIAELEPCPRGIYTGLIGYFDASGDAAFSIAIRTMVQEGKTLHFSVGSGITAGSLPAREYEETLHKAAGLRMAIDAYAASITSSPERAT
jgi:anthranilate/para-aminobenzoate synthase component I